ncbi:NAD(P)H-hydrate dehydratase [Caulobacter endophyticus]|uniref:ADP-dependent (S)-NAD(P)H-hydrate dehydratase n=1 Tax=Caulobacter endophyticus TaxID=2172652 RepID=A0A2T9KCH1_9CAUL|nr:NAD(P)H-hydrate dehydratase [Caulobacter endophyticus]PVM93664.1 NAD(P)H-hydrate dehydratase [Caulobacter endophyticus]
MSQIIGIDAVWARAHRLPHPGDGGKEARGRVLVVGGGIELVGAGRLAGEAALRAGAGKLQLTAPAEAIAVMSLAVPEARVLRLPDDGKPDEALVEALDQADAVLIGPGMEKSLEDLAKHLSRRVRASLVLDAGGLAAAECAGAEVRVLTPHAGEMATLLGKEKSQVEADPVAAAREAARRFGAAVVMKGARTVVVMPDGRVARYAGGGPGLGVSGSGDVLAGVIAGLLARGVAPFEASAWGVYLHGEAGRRLAERVGVLGFLAREIAAEIPRLLDA